MLSLMWCATVGLLPPVHHAEQENSPRRRLPSPPHEGLLSLRRCRVHYFYPNLASTSVGSHSTAAMSSSPPTSSRPSSRPTRKPPPRKSKPYSDHTTKAPPSSGAFLVWMCNKRRIATFVIFRIEYDFFTYILYIFRLIISYRNGLIIRSLFIICVKMCDFIVFGIIKMCIFASENNIKMCK